MEIYMFERVSYMLCLMNFSNMTFVVLLQTVAELNQIMT